ncbi:hypothetical protein CRUP_011848 [Coryphaenoides rupestris]|nr:hypothetical protein CRUP_011848 [Coryphaenoides rupestris]
MTNQTDRLVAKVNSIKASGITGPYKQTMDNMEKSTAEISTLLAQNPATQPLDLMAELSEKLNQTEEFLDLVRSEDNGTNSKLDPLRDDAQKLQRTVQELLDQVEFIKNSDIRGATDSVTKYYQQSLAAEARANASTIDPGNPTENSAILREATERKMNETKEEFDRQQEEHAKRLDDLAGELETLDLSELSEKTCGSPAGQQACADSPCGGLSCVDDQGKRRCGGDGCGGLVTLAHSTWQKAQDFEKEITGAMKEVDKLSKMVSEAKVKADEAKMSAQDVLQKTNQTKQQDAADLESIEKVANEVLAMQMPTTPALLQNLTEEIRERVGNLGHVEGILNQSAEDIQKAENLLEEARRASKEASDVRDSALLVKEALEEAERAQAAASQAIRQANADIQDTKKLLSSVESEATDSEFKLNNATQRLQVLERDVTLLREQVQNTSLSVEQTEKDAHSINQVAEKVKKSLDTEIKDKYATVEGLISGKGEGVAEAKKRAELLQQEAKELLLQASDKLQILKDLEKSYEDNQRTLEERANQMVELEKAVKELLADISQKVTFYSGCQL